MTGSDEVFDDTDEVSDAADEVSDVADEASDTAERTRTQPRHAAKRPPRSTRPHAPVSRRPRVPAGEPTEAEPPPWRRGETGRWEVGDPGRQKEVLPKVSLSFGVTRPDTIIDGGALERISFRGASLRGTSHQEHGVPRQDAFRAHPSINGNWLVGCVADGVSAAKRSHEAADLACATIAWTLAQAMPDGPPTRDEWRRQADALPWLDAALAANREILTAATNLLQRVWTKRQTEDSRARLARAQEVGQVDPSEAQEVMATTAMAFVVSGLADEEDGFPFAVALLAGDCAAAVMSGGRWTPLTQVKNHGNDIASSAVRPLPMRDSRIREEIYLRTGHLRAGDCLAVYSDGVGDAMGTGATQVGSFLADVWRTPPDLLDFAQQVGFYRKTFADDRTAVAIWVERDRTPVRPYD